MAFERGSVLRGVAAGVLALTVLTGVSACGGNRGGGTFTTQSDEPGFNPFKGRGGGTAAPRPGSLGVNGFRGGARRGALAFMPLASADPYGGVIVTDWSTNPEWTTRRFKATVYILDTRLRADGLNVTIFKQINNGGTWTDTAATEPNRTDIEDALLTRARQVRLSTIRN